MSPRDFVSCVRVEVIEENLRSYDHFLAGPADQINDSVWRRIARSYGTMNEDQQTALLLLARQVMIDTASNLFGILDGSSILRSHREEFSLTYGESDEKLNGDLQDYLLAEVEDKP